MTTKVVPGLLIATPEPAQAAREAVGRMAKSMRDAIRDRGQCSIALSGGSSPIAAYELLAKESFDWSKVHVFWVDERAVPPSHERSNFAGAKKALLDPAGIPEANVHRMRGEATDLEAAAAEYEATLQKNAGSASGVPSLDLVVLGIGDDGHTASLFPGERTVHITDKLVSAVPARDGREARLTLTAPVLENAKASVLIVLGKAKHPALERVWSTSGSLDETPARVVRGFRGAVTWVIDRAAGGLG